MKTWHSKSVLLVTQNITENLAALVNVQKANIVWCLYESISYLSR